MLHKRQTNKPVSKQLLRDADFGTLSKRKKKAIMARKKLRTIGKRLVRELERKLPGKFYIQYADEFEKYKKVLIRKEVAKKKFTVYTSHKRLVSPKERHIKLMNWNKSSRY